MNVLAAPSLYVFPTQIEAFACFTAFLEIEAPRYVRPTLWVPPLSSPNSRTDVIRRNEEMVCTPVSN